VSFGDSSYERVNDYVAVKISLARPHDIRSWSFGEVKKPETINYRTYRPERDGLFCERIFGPEKDYECACGKYRGMKYKGMVCDRCGVKITHSRVRRTRMGHIELAAPVVHIWFFRTNPNRLATLLDMKASSLEKVIYYQDYVVIDPGDTPLQKQQTLTEQEYRELRREYGEGAFKADMGAEAIRKLLLGLDLVALSQELRAELATTTAKQRRKELIERLRLVEGIRDSDNRPEWMVLDVIPVIPPDLRPLVLLDSGNFATSDLNDLYRRIINRNNRLKKLVDLNAPEVIIRNEKRMLQQAVDALFDNGHCRRPVVGSSSRPLKSLTDMIKGKQGRFRENLLGKRVDYSARSVIVVGPSLKLHQCGLPKRIALELYQPFIIRRLRELGHADTIKSAKKMLERRDEEVWDILDEVTRNHPVLLNRAPTLHRMGIQAFEPVLIDSNAIQLHPLVCKAYNADFDGDQMAVHLPLSIEAQVEAYTLLLSVHNIFSPAHGKPIISATQDIVMGCYYLTAEVSPAKGDGMCFSSFDEVELAHSLGKVDTHAKIKVRLPKGMWVKDHPEIPPGSTIETTVGRVLFHRMLPPGMPFYNKELTSGDLATVISDCYHILGRKTTIKFLDEMNKVGFHWATRSGLSFALDDLITPTNKWKIIEMAEREAQKVNRDMMRGAITEKERYNAILDIWTKARDAITKELMEALRNDRRKAGFVNPIYLMAISGARGGPEQIRQLAGMRGLMAKPSGEIIETPIKANLREGLSVLEYFSSTHGARKGLADTALKTADSGYLTRKLVDVAQNVVITMRDCGTTQGIAKSAVMRGDKAEVTLREAIYGRVSRRTIVNPVTDEVIVRENELITAEAARKIEALNVQKIQVRSPMTCEAPLGVCALCYGMDLSTGQLAEEGLAVGVIAAQSIGEPGTQLTMRTFHIGGAAARVVEESEVRSKHPGIVRLTNVRYVRNNKGELIVLGQNDSIVIVDSRGRVLDSYTVPRGAVLKVEDGTEIQSNQVLAKWDPHSTPVLSQVGGRVRFEEIIEGETLLVERTPDGGVRRSIKPHKGKFQPAIRVEDSSGKILDIYYLRENTQLEVEEGEEVSPGTVLARTPREITGTQDITGGLPRVTELFEARKPKDPAVIAEIDGRVEILSEKRRGKRTIIIRSETGIEREHLVSPGKQLRVHTGDYVRAGDPLVEGPLNPQDILRISGEEALQQYLLSEIQNVYRSQKVDINDKHIEIIIAQMLRKVKVEEGGDTGLLEGTLMDKFEFRRRNEELARCVKITDPGDTKFRQGEIVPREVFEQENARVEMTGGTPATATRPTPATASTQLLGIAKAAVQSDSFISAASFQETTKVLTEAALFGKVDRLVGLKENVILGRLIPAGTGFQKYQKAEVRIAPEALAELGMRRAPEREPTFPLLEADLPRKSEPLGLQQTSASRATPVEATGVGAEREQPPSAL
jgi:DNA-directed RNA polymerase subunit beta'